MFIDAYITKNNGEICVSGGFNNFVTIIETIVYKGHLVPQVAYHVSAETQFGKDKDVRAHRLGVVDGMHHRLKVCSKITGVHLNLSKSNTNHGELLYSID